MEIGEHEYQLELKEVAARFVDEIKLQQEVAAPAEALPDVLRVLGIHQRLHDENLAVPDLDLIGLTPDNYGKDNHTVRHETNHIILHWCSGDRWLERYADAPDTLNEWLCHNMAVFWAIRQPVVDLAVSIHGPTAPAVLDIALQSKADIPSALRRLVHDCPHTPRAGFILKSDRVMHVEQNDMRLPFWKYQTIDPATLESFFPDFSLSICQYGRNTTLGVVNL